MVNSVFYSKYEVKEFTVPEEFGGSLPASSLSKKSSTSLKHQSIVYALNITKPVNLSSIM